MTRWFEISPNDDGVLDVDATHLWGLPGVRCFTCGRTWAMTGIAYPSVVAADVAELVRGARRHVVSVADFRELRRELAAKLPNHELAPGAEFGPLRGKASGHVSCFAWVNPWTLLLRADAAPKLQAQGLQLTAVPAELQFRRGKAVTLLELEIPPVAEFARASVKRNVSSCEVCGYRDIARPDPLVIDKESLRNAADLVRVREFPTIILGSSWFVSAVQDLGCSELLLKPAAVG